MDKLPKSDHFTLSCSADRIMGISIVRHALCNIFLRTILGQSQISANGITYLIKQGNFAQKNQIHFRRLRIIHLALTFLLYLPISN